jgi:hypothetical protein
MKKLVRERQPEQEKELETMLERYLGPRRLGRGRRQQLQKAHL